MKLSNEHVLWQHDSPHFVAHLAGRFVGRLALGSACVALCGFALAGCLCLVRSVRCWVSAPRLVPGSACSALCGFGLAGVSVPGVEGVVGG